MWSVITSFGRKCTDFFDTAQQIVSDIYKKTALLLFFAMQKQYDRKTRNFRRRIVNLSQKLRLSLHSVNYCTLRKREKNKARNAGFANAARGDSQRRTRCLPTPHAAIGISPCGVCELRLLKSVQKHAENAGFAMWRWQFGH